jgi:glycosyltransferase involved in cell wall biosynthesis
MRIAFIVIGNSRRSNYLNGYNLRYGNGGGSGTDTSSVLVAEHLTKQGHEVVFVTDELEEGLKKKYLENGITYQPGQESYGVKYTNINFDGIDNKEFDILINMLWFDKYEELPIRVTKSIIYWSHMQWIYGVDPLINYAKKHNLSIGLVHISNWEEKMNENIFSILEKTELKCKKIQIPNPIFDEIINEVSLKNIHRKKNKFIFHALWTRGGDVAVEALRNLDLPEKEFHAFDYLMVIHGHTDDFFTNHQGVDKNTLFTHLAESEYFIYPLYTPYKDVHKDTFACTVAEAIALGVIVVTYPLGALPENFKDYCVWLDPPPNSDLEKMQEERLSKDENGIFKYTKNIVDKINYLESNPEIKEQYRNKGRQNMLDNFNINKIGGIWENFINELIN